MHFISSVFCYKYNFLAIFFPKKGGFFPFAEKIAGPPQVASSPVR